MLVDQAPREAELGQRLGPALAVIGPRARGRCSRQCAADRPRAGPFGRSLAVPRLSGWLSRSARRQGCPSYRPDPGQRPVNLGMQPGPVLGDSGFVAGGDVMDDRLVQPGAHARSHQAVQRGRPVRRRAPQVPGVLRVAVPPAATNEVMRGEQLGDRGGSRIAATLGQSSAAVPARWSSSSYDLPWTALGGASTYPPADLEVQVMPGQRMTALRRPGEVDVESARRVRTRAVGAGQHSRPASACSRAPKPSPSGLHVHVEDVGARARRWRWPTFAAGQRSHHARIDRPDRSEASRHPRVPGQGALHPRPLSAAGTDRSSGRRREHRPAGRGVGERGAQHLARGGHAAVPGFVVAAARPAHEPGQSAVAARTGHGSLLGRGKARGSARRQAAGRGIVGAGRLLGKPIDVSRQRVVRDAPTAADLHRQHLAASDQVEHATAANSELSCAFLDGEQQRGRGHQ